MRPCSHHWSDYCDDCGKVKAPEPVVEKHDWAMAPDEDENVCKTCDVITKTVGQLQDADDAGCTARKARESHDWKNINGRDLAVRCTKCGLETANNDVSMNMMDSAYLCSPKASAVDKMLGSNETLHKEGKTRTVGAEVALERDQLKKTVAELREIVAALEEHIKFIYNK